MSPEKKIILVVEDEPLLRITAMDLVESCGFEALEATDSSEAMAILEKRGDVSIVFTDVSMPPGRDGTVLAAEVRERWPHVHVVITSGALSKTSGRIPRDTIFFAKPYNDQRVAEVFRSLAS
ncbi:MAG: response regulator [Reyranella sp.]|nr:response regulator [Reyranella sp.]